MTSDGIHSLPGVSLTHAEIFPNGDTAREYINLAEWVHPISYFVGRNGTGKSKTAKLVANRVHGHFLSTDRLAGLMTYTNYGWTSVPNVESLRGVPLGMQERNQARGFSQQAGTAIDEIYALKDQPAVWLRVAAFVRRALGRIVELRESSGFLDPYIRVGNLDYSLLREEGHGLRELIVLLAATYRSDWSVLVVDEPELHLHPSLVRLWITELERECQQTGRRAIVVTHEPSLLRPTSSDDLGAIWYFALDQAVMPISSYVQPIQEDRVTSSLQQNPELISQLVFAPRPVLVEGIDDVTALQTSLTRTQPPEVVAQTQLVNCGGSGGVALWLEIASRMHLDVRAVADLDACLTIEAQRVMDATQPVTDRYRSEFQTEPPRTSIVLRPLIEAMNAAEVATDPKSRSEWLATEVAPGTGWAARRDLLLAIWRDAGLWLHPQGTLEGVLGTSSKGREIAREAATTPGAIDRVAEWAAYDLDPLGDVEILLGAAVERIAHSIMEAQRVDPSASFNAPVGSAAESDGRLVSIEAKPNGVHRIVVKEPPTFSGYWLEFSRDTPSSGLTLTAPVPAVAAPTDPGDPSSRERSS